MRGPGGRVENCGNCGQIPQLVGASTCWLFLAPAVVGGVARPVAT